MAPILSESNRLSVTTRCRNLDQLVTALKRYVGEDTLFIVTVGKFAVGTSMAFDVTFWDGATALSGTGRVHDTWTTTDNPYGVPGVLLAIDSLDGVGAELFRGMLRQRVVTLTTVPPPPPAKPDALKTEDGVKTNDGVPELVTSDRAITSTGPEDDRPILLAQPVATPITVPVANKTRRRFFKSVPRFSIVPSPPPVTVPDDDDLFSTPTRVATPVYSRRSQRSTWLWMGAVVLALLCGAGLVRAADTLTEHIQVSETAKASETTPATETVPTQTPAGGPTSTIAPGLCLVNFVVPVGGAVRLDGVLQGPTPRTAVTTCGWHRIDVSHPTSRATLMWWGPLIEGQPQTIDLSLAAPSPNASSRAAVRTPVAATSKSKRLPD